MSSEQPEKENKTLLSKEELNRAINKLTQFLDVDEEEEQDDLPEYLRQKNDQEDYLDEVFSLKSFLEQKTLSLLASDQG